MYYYSIVRQRPSGRRESSRQTTEPSDDNEGMEHIAGRHTQCFHLSIQKDNTSSCSGKINFKFLMHNYCKINLDHHEESPSEPAQQGRGRRQNRGNVVYSGAPLWWTPLEP